jgi:release factor glutamine methyltransferase
VSRAALTVAQALALARTLGIDRLDAQLLLAHVAGRERTWVLAHGEACVDAAPIEALLARRAAGEPLAYLTGRREFYGLTLQVTPDVLDPRADTETLVDWALERLAVHPGARVIDLGTGSGAIALAVKHAAPSAQVHALDASAAALVVARANAARLGLDVAFHHGAWWQAVPGLVFDLALANPPYVAAGDPHLAALRHEPAQALVPQGDAGDGLADIERIVHSAPGHLAAGAWLLIEHGAQQAAAVRTRLEARGLRDATTRLDMAGRPRVTGAFWPG